MRKPVIVSILCVAAALSLLVWGFGQPPSQSATPPKQYVLVIEDDTGAFLMQLRKGLQEAAAQQGAQLAVETAAGTPAQQAADFANRNISAALLLLSDPLPLSQALGQAQVPTLIVGQAIRGQVCVLSDDATLGQSLLHRALLLAPAPRDILLLTDDGDAHAKVRAEGAGDLVQKYSVATLPWPQSQAVLRGYGVVVAASSRLTITLADWKYREELPLGCQILGVDTGDRRVQDLESGAVQALTMDSPYAMGYMTLEKARQLSNGELAPSLHTVPGVLIDLANMYLAENVKQVFPLLQ